MILYVHMWKAMYGLIMTALLFHLKLVQDLEEYGFMLNPYDPCGANKIVNMTKMTVTWHINDPKASHDDSVMDIRL